MPLWFSLVTMARVSVHSYRAVPVFRFPPDAAAQASAISIQVILGFVIIVTGLAGLARCANLRCNSLAVRSLIGDCL